MGRRRRLLIGAWAALPFSCMWLPTAAAQQSQPTSSTPALGDEYPQELAAALETVEDLAFRFDHPAVYALLEHVQNTSRSPGHARESIEIDDWRVLLERPSDFRGQPVTVEGVVGHNRPWKYVGSEHPRLGSVWQLDLTRRDQPIACTVLLTHNADDIPLNATIRVTGYFTMIRQYYSETNRVQQAALLIAQAPTLVARDTRPAPTSKTTAWTGLAVALTAGLLIAWILLRRSTAGRRRDLHTLHAEHKAPLSLADDLAAWADDEQTPPQENDRQQ